MNKTEAVSEIEVVSESENNLRLLKKERKKGLKLWDNIFVISMLIIPLIIFINGWVFVNFNSILMAFQLPSGEWSLDSIRLVFEGFKGTTLDKDFAISTALINTGWWFLKSTITLPFQLLVAYFLYKKVTGYKVFQVILYLPSIVSAVAMASMFSSFVAPTGPLGEILSALGVSPVPKFLADSDYAMLTLMFYSTWLGWGGNMLLLGGALARIPLEILESARLDGAGTFREFTTFIIPLVWGTMSTLFILSMTGIFGEVGPVMLFTKGDYETATMGYWIYYKVSVGGVSAYNEVAAVGLLLTLIVVPVVMLIRWLIEKIPVVDY